MSPELARWLLTGAHAFFNNKDLQEWEGYHRENFIYLLTSLLETDNLLEAVSRLERIVAEEENIPSIPQDLASLIAEMEKAQKMEGDAREKAHKKVNQLVAQFAQSKARPVIPLAQAVKETKSAESSRKSPETISAEAETTLTEQIRAALADYDPSLARDPELNSALAQEIGETIAATLLVNPQTETTRLETSIKWILQERGVPLNPKIENTVQKIAAQRRVSPFPPQVSTFSRGDESVPFLPLYALFNPRLTLAYVKKVILTPPVWLLKHAQTSAEWEEIIKKGIFPEDIERTINALKETGFPETHPLVKTLERKRQRILSIQNKPAVRLLKNYYEFDKLTNQPVYDPGTKIPLKREPIWAKGKGYSFILKEAFNKIGSLSHLYEKIPLGPGKTVFRFSLGSKIIRFLTFGRFESFKGLAYWTYRKTIGEVIKIFGKTALGKAAKEGVKKIGTWLAVRLGIEAGITVAGTAAGGPVGLTAATAINIALEVGKKIWDKTGKPLLFFLARLIKDPEKSGGLVVLGAAIMTLLPAATVFGLALMGIGALGLLSNIGGIASGIGNGITAFFGSLLTLPSSGAPVATLILGVLGGTAFLTFFVVMTTAGAFILPTHPTGTIEEVPPPPSPPNIPPPPELVFRWPVSSPLSCSSNFGYRPSPFLGCCEYHEGIDIPANCGSTVYATAKGTVVYAGDGGGYGIVVVIKHAANLFSFYAHLEGVAVLRNQPVEEGNPIGFVGSTGGSTGCHLHFAFSDCGTVPGCFNNGQHTPGPCNYVSCHESCHYRNLESACQGLPRCSK